MQTLLRHVLRSQYKALISILVLITLVVTFFTTIESAIVATQDEISSQVKPTLGGDIRVESPQAWTQEQKDFLTQIQEQYDVTYSQRLSLLYTALDGDTVQSFRMLAVDPQYPLYGEITDTQWQPLTVSTESILLTPRWVDFFTQKNQQATADTGTIIDIEGQRLHLDGVIAASPDLWWFSFVNEGELMYAPLSIITQTDLVTTWSRIEYERLIRTSDEQDIATITDALQESQLFEDVDDYLSANQSIGERVQDFRTFLFVIILAALMLSATILFFTVESFFFRTRCDSAILYLLGASKKQLTLLYVFVFVIVGIIGSSIGILGSYALTAIINNSTDLLTVTLMPDHLIQWVSIPFVLLCMTISLPLIQRLSSSPLSWLKTSLYTSYKTRDLITLFVIWTIGLMTIGYIQLDTIIRALFLVAWARWLVALLVGIGKGCIWLITLATRWLKQTTYAWFDGIRMLTRPGNMTSVMRSSRWLTMISLILVWLFGINISSTLQQTQGELPSAIVLNIPRDQGENIDFGQVGEGTLFSRVGTRIIAVNDTSLADFLGERMSGEFSREYSATIDQLDDPLIAGQETIWAWEISLDNDFARRLGVWLGDTLTISVIGREFDMTIVSLRQRREEIGAFFFLQLPAQQFADAPLTYFATITSTLPSPQLRARVTSNAWPSTTFIDANSLGETIRDITNQILTAVTSFAIALVVISLIVLIVSLTRMVAIFDYMARLYYYIWSPKGYMKQFFLAHAGSILSTSTLFGIIVGGGGAIALTLLSPFLTIDYALWAVFLGAVILWGIILIRSLLKILGTK